jgi:hypothetical protein
MEDSKLDSSGSAEDPVVVCCENDRKLSGSINAESSLLAEKLSAQQEVYPMKLSYTFRRISHEMPKQQTHTVAFTVRETTSETSNYDV